MGSAAREIAGRSRARAHASISRLLGRRRVHAYCVGTGKSGTHSVARALGGLRAAHEPGAMRVVDLLLSMEEGRASHRAIDQALLKRDRSLWLELESSHLLGLLTPRLTRLFPDALFILTVRHPRAWVASQIRHELTRPAAPHWHRWRHARFSGPATPEDSPLLEAGCYPLRGYLRYWERHNAGVLTSVPEERLLVVRTETIGESLERMAQFLGIGADLVVPDAAWSFRSDGAPTPLDKLDPGYIAAMIAQECPTASHLGL